MKSGLVFSGKWKYWHLRNGKVIAYDEADNLIVNQWLTKVQGISLYTDTKLANFYIGLFKGDYTPQATDTAANITANSTELTEYDEGTRVLWVPAAPAAGLITNVASKAAFTFNATVSAYGAFLVSSNTKSGTSGFLVSAVRFPAVRNVVDDDQVLVEYGITASASV